VETNTCIVFRGRLQSYRERERQVVKDVRVQGGNQQTYKFKKRWSSSLVRERQGGCRGIEEKEAGGEADREGREAERIGRQRG